MIRSTLGRITEMIPGAEIEAAYRDIPVKGVSKDSRNVPEASLYIPLAGERFDGHEFVAESVSKGAAGSLWQKDRGDAPEGVPVVKVDDTLAALQQLAAAYRRGLPVKVIGITGSNGKTSTKDMVAAVLGSTYRVHKTQGNLNNHIGLPLTILELDDQIEFAVLEMGMSGFGEIELLTRIAQPDCAIITNIGESHMLQLGSREGIAKAKLEITAGLKPGGTLIYLGDEPLLRSRLSQGDNGRFPFETVLFGSSAHNDYYPESIAVSAQFSEFDAICTNPENRRIAGLRIPLLGRHNVVNALAAVAVAERFGVPEEGLRSGLGGMTPTGMRIESVPCKGGATVLNDAYNASPASMRAALQLLSELSCEGRKMAILGDMLELGPDSERFHREIGRSIEPERVQFVITYGELAAYIAEECRERFAPGTVEAFADKEGLIRWAAERIQSKDIVLVKASRGKRLEEVVHALAQI